MWVTKKDKAHSPDAGGTDPRTELSFRAKYQYSSGVR